MFQMTGYQKSSLQHILSKLSSCLIEALEKDQSVQLTGIGTFSIKTNKARKARNPKTGETVMVPEKTIVHFKMHNSLKNAFKKE
jgi:nucleoid DNA-binding protein